MHDLALERVHRPQLLRLARPLDLIGSIPAREGLLKTPGLHLHDYGKQPRPGRKVGHVTLVEPSAARRDAYALKLLEDLAAGVGFP